MPLCRVTGQGSPGAAPRRLNVGNMLDVDRSPKCCFNCSVPTRACCTPGRARIVHFTPPATQRASLSRSGELTVASFIKIIDSGHQDSQYLATLTFDTTAGAAQDECPASPSPTVVGWMATRMAATPTTVARWMPVPIAVPLAAVGAREKVAPHCVTDLGDYACRQVLLPR